VDYLYDGIPLIIIGLGLFAMPEIVDLLRRDQRHLRHNKLGAGWFQGIRDVMKNWWLTLRCSGIGALIGAIPGLGGTVVDWIAYGHAVQTVKDNPKFGKGDVRGVIAPESANNAKEGGGLLPTLLFGIPGGGAMAVFLGGMVLLGIQPGPSMVGSNLDLTYTDRLVPGAGQCAGGGAVHPAGGADFAPDADSVQAARALHDCGHLLCGLSGHAHAG
jgi:putative tricarboxylic transport membrane protein